MSKSRSVSRSVPAERTISVDPIYAQELIEFWMQKYEQVKEELDYTRVRVPRNGLKTVVHFPVCHLNIR